MRTTSRQSSVVAIAGSPAIAIRSWVIPGERSRAGAGQGAASSTVSAMAAGAASGDGFATATGAGADDGAPPDEHPVGGAAATRTPTNSPRTPPQRGARSDYSLIAPTSAAAAAAGSGAVQNARITATASAPAAAASRARSGESIPPTATS